MTSKFTRNVGKSISKMIVWRRNLIRWATVLSLLFGLSRQEDDCHHFRRLIFEKPGNITITGIFDGNIGENCTSAVEFGVEEMAAAVWTVTALEHYNYLPGLKIGLSLFDACSSSKIAQEAFTEAVIRESCYRQNDSSIGFITTPEIATKLGAFSQRIRKTVTRLEHILDLDGMLSVVAELLTNLHWMTVNRVIADSREILNNFGKKMSDEGICVFDEVLIANKRGMTNHILKPADVPDEDALLKNAPLIVVICKSQQISDIFSGMSREMKESPIKWLLVPTDFVMINTSATMPENVFSILPSVEKVDRLLKFLGDRDMQSDLMNHREATKSPIFVQVAVGILELLKPLKSIHDSHCANLNLSSVFHCSELANVVEKLRGNELKLQEPETIKVTPENIVNALNVLKMDGNDNEAFLYITSLVKREKTEDVAIFQIFDVKSKKMEPILLIVDERAFNEGIQSIRTKRTDAGRKFVPNEGDDEKMRRDGTNAAKENRWRNDGSAGENFDYVGINDKHPCIDVLSNEESNLTKYCGICRNFVKFHMKDMDATIGDEARFETIVESTLAWRPRTWVAINASLASIGIICTLAIVIFIIVRICKGDILEGSPHLSFLVLLSVIFLYASTLPFSVEELDYGQPDGQKPVKFSLVCHSRIVLPTVGYSVMFSVLLSRSIMLALSERSGGFVNHVSGCLQSILCFFMCGVQLALTTQFLIYNTYIKETGRVADCSDIFIDYQFIVLLLYSFLLLMLLALTVPFVVRSKRNYKEGMFFSIAVVFIIAIWSIWITLFLLLPVEERDAAVAFGLTGTATAVLLTVFIPRTYLMTTAIVRDKITSSLPNLAYMNSSSISDANFRSNQALYDAITVNCRTPKLGFSSTRIYSVHMSKSAPASPSCCPAKPDDADRFPNRRKTFIEVPRMETLQNAYETCESPDMNGKITKF